jgi:hypothetical protein
MPMSDFFRIAFRGPFMITRKIVQSCSNPAVARAALASIGGDFAAHFDARASRCNTSAGVLAARMVREFADRETDEERKRVEEAARGSDQPILSGLLHILSEAPLPT